MKKMQKKKQEMKKKKKKKKQKKKQKQKEMMMKKIQKKKQKDRKEGNVLFNDALNTFYFTLIWRRIHQIVSYVYEPSGKDFKQECMYICENNNFKTNNLDNL